MINTMANFTIPQNQNYAAHTTDKAALSNSNLTIRF